jgi:hypothetical protein
MTEEKNETFVRVQGFWEKFQKPVLITVAILVIGIGGWYGYNQYIVKPKEEKASDAMFKAQQYFNLDSSNLVLNGDGQNRGVICNEYIQRNKSG